MLVTLGKKTSAKCINVNVHNCLIPLKVSGSFMVSLTTPIKDDFNFS